jgi:hypothetical protein
LVGHHLVVGYQDDHVDAEVLKSDPVREGAEVVADVQWAGGSITGQDAEVSRFCQYVLFEGSAAVECCSL